MSVPCYVCSDKKVGTAGDVCAGCNELGHKPFKLPGHKPSDFADGVNRLDVLQNNLDLLESQQRLLRRQLETKGVPMQLQMSLTKMLVEISRVLPNLGKETREAEKEHQQKFDSMGYEEFSGVVLESFKAWPTSHQRLFVDKLMTLWEEANKGLSS